VDRLSRGSRGEKRTRLIVNGGGSGGGYRAGDQSKVRGSEKRRARLGKVSGSGVACSWVKSRGKSLKKADDLVDAMLYGNRHAAERKKVLLKCEYKEIMAPLEIRAHKQSAGSNQRRIQSGLQARNEEKREMRLSGGI